MHKCSINPITNPKAICSHAHACDNILLLCFIIGLAGVPRIIVVPSGDLLLIYLFLSNGSIMLSEVYFWDCFVSVVISQ
jgi:hypothetical protein